jgi:hypothetical protein
VPSQTASPPNNTASPTQDELAELVNWIIAVRRGRDATVSDARAAEVMQAVLIERRRMMRQIDADHDAAVDVAARALFADTYPTGKWSTCRDPYAWRERARRALQASR